LPEVICNTSPLQYLHQLDLLHLLPPLVGGIVVPPAVQEELAAGLRAGINLPDLSSLDWVKTKSTNSSGTMRPSYVWRGVSLWNSMSLCRSRIIAVFKAGLLARVESTTLSFQSSACFVPGVPPAAMQALKYSSSSLAPLLHGLHVGTVIMLEGRGFKNIACGGTWSRVITARLPQIAQIPSFSLRFAMILCRPTYVLRSNFILDHFSRGVNTGRSCHLHAGRNGQICVAYRLGGNDSVGS
jgi:hypothetical protein